MDKIRLGTKTEIKPFLGFAQQLNFLHRNGYERHQFQNLA